MWVIWGINLNFLRRSLIVLWHLCDIWLTFPLYLKLSNSSLSLSFCFCLYVCLTLSLSSQNPLQLFPLKIQVSLNLVWCHFLSGLASCPLVCTSLGFFCLVAQSLVSASKTISPNQSINDITEAEAAIAVWSQINKTALVFLKLVSHHIVSSITKQILNPSLKSKLLNLQINFLKL